jgi:D-glycero-D-manno-heptose 1,7-bisphosphate phosphatase
VTSRPAAFLDRDGVLNVRPPEHDYVRSRGDLVLLPGIESVRRLADNGYALVVVSNQRGIARGLVTWETLFEIEHAVREAIGRSVAFYYCPHDLDEGCDCRKPAPGLLLRASEELDLDLARSVMIGDAETDVAAGRAAGTRSILIAPAGTATGADAVVDDLAGAVEFVLELGAG